MSVQLPPSLCNFPTERKMALSIYHISYIYVQKHELSECSSLAFLNDIFAIECVGKTDCSLQYQIYEVKIFCWRRQHFYFLWNINQPSILLNCTEEEIKSSTETEKLWNSCLETLKPLKGFTEVLDDGVVGNYFIWMNFHHSVVLLVSIYPPYLYYVHHKIQKVLYSE